MGFRRNRACRDAILVLRTARGRCRLAGLSVATQFFVLRNAFPSLLHSRLSGLASTDEWLASLVHNLHARSRLWLCAPGEPDSMVVHRRGGRQDCSLMPRLFTWAYAHPLAAWAQGIWELESQEGGGFAPYLWVSFVDSHGSLVRVDLSTTVYADDLAHSVAQPFADASAMAAVLRRRTVLLEHCLAQWGLSLNSAKEELVVNFRGPGALRATHLAHSRTPVSFARSFQSTLTGGRALRGAAPLDAPPSPGGAWFPARLIGSRATLCARSGPFGLLLT